MKIATYNVENLFDLQHSGYEYKEYIPYTRSLWNDKTYGRKLTHIARVIKDIDADIIALQEIESRQALKDLRYTLKRMGLYYPYYKIADLKNTTVKVAFLSKIPFVYAREIAVSASYKYRNILEAKFHLGSEDFYLLINHWKSKSGPESMRVFSAKTLKKRVKELGYDKNIILVGDFNSHYEEHITFRRKRKLNNTDGITGINHILGTLKYQNDAQHTKLDDGDFYNLWYDAPQTQRFTHIYRKKKEALDNILVNQKLLDHKGLEYKPHSIRSFIKPYLYKNGKIQRWKISWKKPKRHLGRGYSDHLAVIAEFTF